MKDDSSQEGIESVCSFDIDCRVSSGRTCSWSQVLGFRERERPASSSMHSSPLSQAFTSISLERTGRMTAGRHLGSRISWFVNTTSFKPLVRAAGLGSGHFEAK